MGAVGYAGYARPADLGNGVVSDQVADMIRQFPAVTSLPAGAWRPGISAVSAAALRLAALRRGSRSYPGDKETPLITAASYGDADVARVLIEARGRHRSHLLTRLRRRAQQ